MAKISEAQQAARIKLVDEHIRAESRGDWDATAATLGKHPYYEYSGEVLDGMDAVRGHYERGFTGFPDLNVEVAARHVSDEAIIVEGVWTGTHQGSIEGVPATGRRVKIPIFMVFTFINDEKILGERVYSIDNDVVHDQILAPS